VAQAIALGPLRVLVNCAGVGWGARIVDKNGGPHDLALFRRILDINLVGTFNMLRLAAVVMVASDPVEGEEREPAATRAAAVERGVIINTASIAAFEGQVGQAAYAASKAGIVGLTLTAARDLASRGIRVVSIAPGLFETPMLGLVPESTRAALVQAMASPRRFGEPPEFASLILEIVRNAYLNTRTGALITPSATASLMASGMLAADTFPTRPTLKYSRSRGRLASAAACSTMTRLACWGTTRSMDSRRDPDEPGGAGSWRSSPIICAR